LERRERFPKHGHRLQFGLVQLGIVVRVVRLVVRLVERLSELALLAQQGADIAELLVTAEQLADDVLERGLGFQQAPVQRHRQLGLSGSLVQAGELLEGLVVLLAPDFAGRETALSSLVYPAIRAISE